MSETCREPASMRVASSCVSLVEPMAPLSCALMLSARSRQKAFRVSMPVSNSS